MQKDRRYLIGKKLNSIKISSSKDTLVFNYEDNERMIAVLAAECCSHTWIEHCEINTSLAAKIISIEEIEMPETPDLEGNGEIDPYYGGYVQCYALKINTDKGTIQFDFRNESNGYYGGAIEFGEEAWLTEEFKQSAHAPAFWDKLEEDFVNLQDF